MVQRVEAELINAVFPLISSTANTMGLPVYWPNVATGEPANTHLRISVLPTTPRTLTTCGGSQHQWIVQIAVYVRDGVGAVVPAQHADTLRGSIPFLTTVSSGSYTFKSASVGEVIPAVKTDGWYFVPVQFRFMTVN